MDDKRHRTECCENHPTARHDSEGFTEAKAFLFKLERKLKCDSEAKAYGSRDHERMGRRRAKPSLSNAQQQGPQEQEEEQDAEPAKKA
jgi:replication initiation and membrane attachment protein DnaB